MKKKLKALYLFGRFCFAVCCLLALNSCSDSDIKIISKSDLNNIKLGGLVTLQGRTNEGKLFKFTSECDLLGIKEYNNDDENSINRLFTSNFQTVNKPENLNLDLDFETSEVYGVKDTTICSVTKLVGGFTLDGKYNSIDSTFDKSFRRVATVINLNKPGQKTYFDMIGLVRSNGITDTFRISIETILLPK